MKVKTFTDERIIAGSNIIDLVKSGLYVHIVSNFTGKLSPEDAEVITYGTDHDIQERFKDVLYPWLLIRSGADMPLA